VLAPQVRDDTGGIALEHRLARRRRKRTLADELGARFAERLARLAGERARWRPLAFLPAPDKRKSVSIRRRAIERHADEEPVAGVAESRKTETAGTAILFLAGPTASGKSGLALALAEATGAEIVNADSMQVYADLSVVTARPGAEDLARAPHHLYGHVDAAENYSVGRWSQAVLAQLQDIVGRGKPAIVVGGTGLYFKAMTDGLADVPDPGPDAENHARELLAVHGIEALRALAEKLDPVGAAAVKPNDRQRLMRLVAVARGLGRPLSELRAGTTPPALPGTWAGLVLLPERAGLYRRIDARAAEIVDRGGPEEAARLLSRGLNPELPAMKALGVAQLGGLASGRLTRAGALEQLAGDTRRYAKRQLTWFRHQTSAWPRIEAPDVQAALEAWRGRRNR
jgi:tRNA dimethylallyltransferase